MTTIHTGNTLTVAGAVLANIIRHPNWPIPGVDFADLTLVYGQPDLLKMVASDMAERLRPLNPTHIAGLDARGFILGTGLALSLNLPFVMIRKKGKTPGDCHTIDYALEYGTASIQLQKASLPANSRVILADDLLATGGTLEAAANLVRSAGSTVLAAAVIIDIPALKARSRLDFEVVATTQI